MTALIRCAWSGADPLSTLNITMKNGAYRSGAMIPALLKRICLEGATGEQAGSRFCAKRENYRAAFDGFDPAVVAHYEGGESRNCWRTPALRATVKDRLDDQQCQKFLEVQRRFGSFSDYHWGYVV
ncbi:MAG: DNA-3-methyladenine glycosylase I [Chloroflexi bacterium]|uniref:DNA-3-methyladenine glycosylase I n=1 Tax=Candidatus Flexifilum breve TaxID=3140694 RepID=UPI00313506A7|nr:DNA-3-methyladenine glycosylase I [Chloroflexota bacterium]